jgi:hypothetical protein
MAGGGNGMPVDYEALERWTRMAMSRGMRFAQGRAPTSCGKTLAQRDQLPERSPGHFSASFVSFAPCCVTGLLLG